MNIIILCILNYKKYTFSIERRGISDFSVEKLWAYLGSHLEMLHRWSNEGLFDLNLFNYSLFFVSDVDLWYFLKNWCGQGLGLQPTRWLWIWHQWYGGKFGSLTYLWYCVSQASQVKYIWIFPRKIRWWNTF